MIPFPASGIHAWTAQALEARRAEGRRLAQKLFPGDAKWENRLISLAQGVSERPWLTFQLLPKELMVKVVDGMIASGAPFDEPYEQQSMAVH